MGRRVRNPTHALGERLNRVVAAAVAPRLDAVDDRLAVIESSLASLHARSGARHQRDDAAGSLSQSLQRVLALRYQDLQRAGALPDLRDVGFRVYSQADED